MCLILTKTIYFILSLDQNKSMFLFLEMQCCNTPQRLFSQTEAEDNGMSPGADRPDSLLEPALAGW